MNRTAFFAALLLLPSTAFAADWQDRLNDALSAGWEQHKDAWTALETIEPRMTRAGHLRFNHPDMLKDSAVPLVLDRLVRGEDPEPVRAALADVFGRHADGWGDALVEVLAEEPSSAVRATLVYGLRHVDAEFAEAGFTVAFADVSSNVRAEAARVAARRADASVVPTLPSLLADDSAEVRLEALRAAAVLGDAQLIPAAEGLVADPDPIVRKAAVRTVERLR